MRIKIAVAALAIVLAPTLAAAQKTSYDYNKSTDFTTFKTYALKDGTKVGQQLIDDRIVSAIETELAAKGFTKSDNPDSELSPDKIEVLVAQDRGAWVKLAHGLQDAGSTALKAIEAKDSEGLSNAGGDIDAACESCHVKYWYPNKKAA